MYSWTENNEETYLRLTRHTPTTAPMYIKASAIDTFSEVWENSAFAFSQIILQSGVTVVVQETAKQIIKAMEDKDKDE